MGLFKNNNDSKDIAKKRLKKIISYEKNNLSSEKLDIIKSEILFTVSDYFPVDRESSQVFIMEDKQEPALVAILPFTRD